MNRLIALCLLCCITIISHGQITTVALGVNGLTCSQCTRSVEMRIRKLDFVKDVHMNLEHTEGQIVFKENKKVDIDKIAQAVVDAGFSVRYLQADFTFNNLSVAPNYCFEYNGDHYQFIETQAKKLNGEKTIKFIGPKYIARKELKKWQPYMKNNCGAGKVYYITI